MTMAIDDALTPEEIDVLVSFVDRVSVLDTPSGHMALLLELSLDPAFVETSGTAHERAVILVHRLVAVDNRAALYKLVKRVCKQIDPERHPELAHLCQRLGVVSAPPDDPIVAPAPVRGEAIVHGFDAVSKLTQDQRIKDAVVQFAALFEISRKSIREVADYKHMHDQLHNLEQRVELPMQRLACDFPGEDAKLEFEEYRRDFENVTFRLREIASRALVDDTAWIQKLEAALDDLRKALENDDVALLRDVIKRVGREVALMPPRINKRLFAAASGLRLGELVVVLKDVRDRAQILRKDADQLDRVRAAIDVLDRMNSNLRTLIDTHDQWQEVDTLLRAMDKNTQTLEDLSDLWSRARELVELILTRFRSERWVPLFVEDITRLENDIGSSEVTRVSRSVRLMRRQVGNRFYNTDADLKKQCDELSTVGEPLTTVLRVLQ